MADEPFSGVGLRITSDPDTTRIEQPAGADARRSVSLPLRIMLVSDLAPDYEGPPFRDVDAASFGDLIASVAPRLRLDVANHLSDTPDRLELELHFSSISDFRPERLAEQVPALAALVAVRRALAAFGSGSITKEEVGDRLERAGIDADWIQAILQAIELPPTTAAGSAPPPQAPADADAVDRLLGMIDVPGDAAPATPSSDSGEAEGLLGALLGAATGPAPGARSDAAAIASLTADLDRTLAAQVRAILEHPHFQQMEAAWRGVKFMVDHVDSRRGVRLDVLPASREGLSEAVYTRVLMPEHQQHGEGVPLSVLLVGFDFDASADDVALLEDLAETGASLQIPALASASPAFFGVTTARGLEQLPPLRQYLDGPEWIPWNKLRDREVASHLALAVPGMLARYRYGERDPVRDFSVEERHDLWLGGAYLLAVAIARSYVATGWTTRFLGAGAGVENLPLRADPRGAVPLAAVLSDDRQADLAEAGFVVVGCRPNRDAAYVLHAPTIRRTPRYDDAAADAETHAHGLLSTQLFLSRVAQLLLAFQTDLAVDSEPETARVELDRRLRTLLRAADADVADDAVRVEAVGAGDQLAIRLRPPAAVLDQPIGVVLGIRLPGVA